LIGENTARRVENSFRLREIDMVRAKGKEAPVRIYELLARAGTSLPAEREEADEMYMSGLADYRRQAWEKALKHFNRAMSVWPDAAAETMAKRCHAYLHSPPEEGWDGVFEQISK
ncbi:MAG: hypothetical protein U9Q05_00690, partial [Thermodesulfobacteriota bacterium]|nr:hypothetical protein [Thermodesulfobacteriota bacterium]